MGTGSLTRGLVEGNEQHRRVSPITCHWLDSAPLQVDILIVVAGRRIPWLPGELVEVGSEAGLRRGIDGGRADARRAPIGRVLQGCEVPRRRFFHARRVLVILPSAASRIYVDIRVDTALLEILGPRRAAAHGVRGCWLLA